HKDTHEDKGARYGDQDGIAREFERAHFSLYRRIPSTCDKRFHTRAVVVLMAVRRYRRVRGDDVPGRATTTVTSTGVVYMRLSATARTTYVPGSLNRTVVRAFPSSGLMGTA